MLWPSQSLTRWPILKSLGAREFRNPKNYSIQAYERDLTDHLIARLENDRKIVVPWLDSANF